MNAKSQESINHANFLQIHQQPKGKINMQILEQPKLENISLYYREGTSDKIYQCAIEPAGERFGMFPRLYPSV
jgi:hypothetical protein